MEVYIVTQGQYSDYHIVAVFSTQEQAKRYIEEANTPPPKGQYRTRDSHCIEVFKVDKRGEYRLLPLWYCYFSLDGKIQKVEEDYPEMRKPIDSGVLSFPRSEKFKAYSTVSAEHACKVAVEAIQAHKRAHLEELRKEGKIL